MSQSHHREGFESDQRRTTKKKLWVEEDAKRNMSIHPQTGSKQKNEDRIQKANLRRVWIVDFEEATKEFELCDDMTPLLLWRMRMRTKRKDWKEKMIESKTKQLGFQLRSKLRDKIWRRSESNQRWWCRTGREAAGAAEEERAERKVSCIFLNAATPSTLSSFTTSGLSTAEEEKTEAAVEEEAALDSFSDALRWFFAFDDSARKKGSAEKTGKRKKGNSALFLINLEDWESLLESRTISSIGKEIRLFMQSATKTRTRRKKERNQRPSLKEIITNMSSKSWVEDSKRTCFSVNLNEHNKVSVRKQLKPLSLRNGDFSQDSNFFTSYHLLVTWLTSLTLLWNDFLWVRRRKKTADEAEVRFDQALKSECFAEHFTKRKIRKRKF